MWNKSRESCSSSLTIPPALVKLKLCLCAVSLSRFIVVPHKVLDTELKKSFAHFNEGRIPVSTLSVKKQSDFIYRHFFFLTVMCSEGTQ